jgi:mono/diheme cytochrome c family protein
MPEETSGWFRRRVRRRALAALLALGLVLVGSVVGVRAAPAAQPEDQGRELFAQRCASCHTVGAGNLVGPDLKGVVEARDAAWLERWIVEPDTMLAEGDPIAVELLKTFNDVPMPNMGVTPTEAQAIIAFLAASSAAPGAPAPAPEPAPAPVAPTGDPALGMQLFTGQVLLANGGTACISCHNVSQVSVMGGGSLGPDLSHVAARYGDAGLSAALAGLPFPSMQGVFAERPLTEQEVEHLGAYFRQAEQAAPAQMPVRYTFVWVALAGALVLLGFSHVLWIGRHRGVRKPLVSRMRQR